MRAIDNQIFQREQQSDNYSSSILEESDQSNNAGSYVQDPNNSQRFREAYQFTTFEECKVED